MRTCPTCNQIRWLKARNGKLLVEIRSKRVVTTSEFGTGDKFYFCPECGRAIRRDAFEHKKEVLSELIENCSECVKSRKKRERENSN